MRLRVILSDLKQEQYGFYREEETYIYLHGRQETLLIRCLMSFFEVFVWLKLSRELDAKIRHG